MKRFEHKLQFEQYNPGDLVLVRNTALEMHITQFKTTDRYMGPFIIKKRTTKGNYVLQELDGTVRATPVAAFRILPYISRTNNVNQDLKFDKARKSLNNRNDDDNDEDPDSSLPDN